MKKYSLVTEIERALELGRFISYNQTWNFIQHLEKIDTLVKQGNATRAVNLYARFEEAFLKEREGQKTIYDFSPDGSKQIS